MGSKSLLPVPRSTRRYPLAVPFWAVCAALRTRHSAWSWPLTWLPWYLSLVPVFPSYLHLLHRLAAVPYHHLVLFCFLINLPKRGCHQPWCHCAVQLLPPSSLCWPSFWGWGGSVCCAVRVLPRLLASTCFTMSAVLHHHSIMWTEVACFCWE